MVKAVAHGGSCCGARHMYSFGTNEEANPDLITRVLSGLPSGRRVEVILNGTQMNSYPRILAKLAELGFVMTEHYINDNHGSDNYVFSRCDKRRAVGHQNWTGQIITPGMHGNFPALPAELRNLPMVTDTADLPQVARVNGPQPGQRYRVESPTSRFHRQIAQVIRAADYDGRVTLRSDNGEVFQIVRTNLVFAAGDQQGGAIPANVVIPAMRHEVPDSAPFPVVRAAQPAGAPAAAPAPGNRAIARQDLPTRDTAPTGTRVVYSQGTARPIGSLGTVNRWHSDLSLYIDWDNPVHRTVMTTGRNNVRVVEMEAIPPAAQPTRVFSTFHNVSRDGTRGAGYDTYALAHANRGRRTRIDRREIMSNGVSVWHERVVA